MVTSIFSVSRSGVKDFLLQRISAIVLAVYSVWTLIFFLGHAHTAVSFKEWRGLFEVPLFKVFTLTAVVALLIHAWIGVWTIITDYVKPLAWRFAAEVLLILISFVELVWSLMILWS